MNVSDEFSASILEKSPFFMKMGVSVSSETFVTMYQSTQCKIPEDSNHYQNYVQVLQVVSFISVNQIN
jgi:hypothetical protein